MSKDTQSSVAVNVDAKAFKPVTKFSFNHQADSLPEAIGLDPVDIANNALERILKPLSGTDKFPRSKSSMIEVFFAEATQEELEAVAMLGLVMNK